MQPLTALLVARGALEAVVLACAGSLLHVITAGRDPLPLIGTSLLCFGSALILVALLRDARAERQNAILTAGVIGGAIVLGLAQPTRGADALAILTRAVGFGILGEIFLWRSLGVARGIARWRDARNVAVWSAVAVAAAAVVPGVDSGPLAVIALAAAAATAVALSLARTAEELELAGTRARGSAGGASASSVALVVGALSIGAAFLAPALGEMAAEAGRAMGPVLERIVYLIALPFGYLAALLVPVFRPLAELLFRSPAVLPSPEEQAQQELMRRALDETRPLVFGAIEVLIALVAVVFALVLVDRLTRERRSELPPGATLERAGAAGYGVQAMLAGLLPARSPRRWAPRDDGSAAAAVRLAYWRFLELSDRAGAGWREASETPAEHHARIRRLDPRWAAAQPIVTAFERLRYGDEAPPANEVGALRTAVAQLPQRAPAVAGSRSR